MIKESVTSSVNDLISKIGGDSLSKEKRDSLRQIYWKLITLITVLLVKATTDYTIYNKAMLQNTPKSLLSYLVLILLMIRTMQNK